MAKSSALKIVGLGHFHPPQVIDNSFFVSEIGLDTSPGWIEERTGIRSRHSVVELQELKERWNNSSNDTPSRTSYISQLSCTEGSAHAWKNLITRHLKEEIKKFDYILTGTSVPDWEIPNHASKIASTLGFEGKCLDINSACSSFLSNLHTLRSLTHEQKSGYSTIFVPERYTLALDFSDRRSSILFGDGFSASLLEVNSKKLGLEVIDTHLESAPAGADLIEIEKNHYFQQNGAAVQKFAVRKTVEAVKEICEKNQFPISELNYFVGHQANLRMLQSVIKKLGLSEQQHLYNVDTKGNQGGAGAPIVLSENWEQFKKGDVICVAVVGSGLMWGSALLRFN